MMWIFITEIAVVVLMLVVGSIVRSRMRKPIHNVAPPALILPLPAPLEGVQLSVSIPPPRTPVYSRAAVRSVTYPVLPTVPPIEPKTTPAKGVMRAALLNVMPSSRPNGNGSTKPPDPKPTPIRTRKATKD